VLEGEWVERKYCQERSELFTLLLHSKPGTRAARCIPSDGSCSFYRLSRVPFPVSPNVSCLSSEHPVNEDLCGVPPLNAFVPLGRCLTRDPCRNAKGCRGSSNSPKECPQAGQERREGRWDVASRKVYHQSLSNLSVNQHRLDQERITGEMNPESPYSQDLEKREKKVRANRTRKFSCSPMGFDEDTN